MIVPANRLNMSFTDFEKGIPTIPFCQRAKQLHHAEDANLLARFNESERRQNILRSITAIKHEPTKEEIKRWIDATKTA